MPNLYLHSSPIHPNLLYTYTPLTHTPFIHSHLVNTHKPPSYLQFLYAPKPSLHLNNPSYPHCLKVLTPRLYTQALSITPQFLHTHKPLRYSFHTYFLVRSGFILQYHLSGNCSDTAKTVRRLHFMQRSHCTQVQWESLKQIQSTAAYDHSMGSTLSGVVKEACSVKSFHASCKLSIYFKIATVVSKEITELKFFTRSDSLTLIIVQFYIFQACQYKLRTRLLLLCRCSGLTVRSTCQALGLSISWLTCTQKNGHREACIEKSESKLTTKGLKKKIETHKWLNESFFCFFVLMFFLFFFVLFCFVFFNGTMHNHSKIFGERIRNEIQSRHHFVRSLRQNFP